MSQSNDIEHEPPREVSEPRLRDYDPRPARENVRGRLAFSLLGLLAALTLVLLWVVASGTRTWDEVQGVATLTFGPIASLTGTMLGFYYGQEQF